MMISGENLGLSADQKIALAALAASAHAMRFVGNIVRDAASPSIASAASAVVGGTKCPFGHPPADIIGDFDGTRHLYLRCLHSPRHCWDFGGNPIPCP